MQGAGGCLFHLDINHDLVGGRAFASLHIGAGEQAQGTDTRGRLANFARVERVTFNDAELTTDNAIQRRCVARDVDPFDKNARPLDQRKINVQRQIRVVARHPRLNTDQVQPFALCQSLHPRNRIIDQFRRVGATGANAGQPVKVGRIHARHFGRGGDLAELVFLAFLNGEGQEKSVALTRKLIADRKDLEIDIAARLIEIAQQHPIQPDAIFDKRVLADQEAQGSGLLGFEDAAQAAVRKGAVADE